MNRRQLLCRVGPPVLLGFGGCLGTGGPNDDEDAVGLVMENNGNEKRTVSTEIADWNDEVVFSDEYSVSAGGEVSTGPILPAGDYTVRVEVDGVGETTFQFYMSGCDENTIMVEFDREIYVQTGCHAD